MPLNRSIRRCHLIIREEKNKTILSLSIVEIVLGNFVQLEKLFTKMKVNRILSHFDGSTFFSPLLHSSNYWNEQNFLLKLPIDRWEVCLNLPLFTRWQRGGRCWQQLVVVAIDGTAWILQWIVSLVNSLRGKGNSTNDVIDRIELEVFPYATGNTIHLKTIEGGERWFTSHLWFTVINWTIAQLQWNLPPLRQMLNLWWVSLL